MNPRSLPGNQGKTMASSKWSDAEIAKLKQLKAAGVADSKIAEELGRTYRSVTHAVRQYTAQVEVPEIDYRARADHWQSKAGELQRALDKANESRTAVDVLVEQIMELAPKAYAPPVDIYRAPRKSKSSPQSAVCLFSDTHIGAVVKPEQTLGLGGYNFNIFLRRLWRLQQSIFSIMNDHTTTEVPEIVVPILGDMLDGALSHAAGHAIAQFLRNLSTLANLRVYGCVGNHTRWQNQKKMPTKNRNSNMDMLLYLYVEALLRDCPFIKCEFNMQPFALFDVQGFSFYAGHGDNLRGGDKMLGIPNHAMGRMVSTTSQLFTRAGRKMPDYYVVGHLHRPIDLPHSKGSVLVNGAFPGIDGYALGEYFNSSHPVQRFFFMHPKFGMAAEYKLRLDIGDTTEHGFKLPPSTFVCE
jgi:predicted MPP superfamily phosphohydrolase